MAAVLPSLALEKPGTTLSSNPTNSKLGSTTPLVTKRSGVLPVVTVVAPQQNQAQNKRLADLKDFAIASPSGSSTQGAGDDNDATRGYVLEQFVADADGDLDDDEEFEYNHVPIEEFEDIDEELDDEDLEQAVRNINAKNFLGAFPENAAKPSEAIATLTKRPEVIDDYIRNYLSSKGMIRALDVFQNEWYELQQKGSLSVEDLVTVPDVYQRNMDLEEAVKKLRIDVEDYKGIADKARSTYSKLRKERDFHRMHHKRVVQEKNRLIMEIKKLKKHYDSYEPTLKQLQHKYEVAMKERMLVRLERDRLSGKVSSLETILRQLEKTGNNSQHASRKSAQPTAHQAKPSSSISRRTTALREAVLPSEDRPNPHLGAASEKVEVRCKVDALKRTVGFKAHEDAVSSIKFHPRKMILATVSDDKTWKMWAFPSGELILSGDGHKDWIGDCDFHPRGAHLATASGDGTVKVWDFSKGQSTLTLLDHTQAVWSCAFHDQGDFLISGSMDHTAKLWDLNTGNCRQTFRGHVDSVNHVTWQPYTNTVVTASADKAVSFWDARSGLCTQTLTGHTNAVNCATFNLQSDKIATCDASGILKIWDARQPSTVIDSVDFGPHPANKASFDPSGTIVAVASNDGTVKLWNAKQRCKAGADVSPVGSAGGSSFEPVQSVAFDRSGEYLVMAGYDGTVGFYS